MDPAFQRAALLRPRPQDQPCILGLRLNPFTVGHLFLFVQYDALTFNPQRETELSDFIIALFICARPWRKAESDLRRWWFPMFCRIWERRIAQRNWIAELLRFKEWLEIQYTAPEVRVPQGHVARQSSGAPTCWSRLNFLVTKCAMPLADALDLPLQVASAMYATWLDAEQKAELHYVEPSSALWEFARAEDAKRFNADGTKKELN